MGRLYLELITPEGTMVSQEVDNVVAPGTEGEFGVLLGHVAFLTGIFALSFLRERGPTTQDQLLSKCFHTNKCLDENRALMNKYSKIKEVLHYGFIEMIDDVGIYILIGLFAAGLVAAMLPQSVIEQHLGEGLLPLFIMVLIGTPMYVCSTASVPFVAAMVAKGMHPAAGLVFLTAGPATNISTILVIGKVMGKETAILYVSSIIFLSVLIAYGFCLSGWV